VTNLITPRALFSPTFLQSCSLFHASDLDNPFPVRCKDLVALIQAELYAFLSKISLIWQRGSVVVEFVCHGVVHVTKNYR